MRNADQLTWKSFEDILYQKTEDIGRQEDRCIRQKDNSLATILVKKRAMHGFYIKRRVACNLVDTTPHDL